MIQIISIEGSQGCIRQDIESIALPREYLCKQRYPNDDCSQPCIHAHILVELGANLAGALRVVATLPCHVRFITKRGGRGYPPPTTQGEGIRTHTYRKFPCYLPQEPTTQASFVCVGRLALPRTIRQVIFLAFPFFAVVSGYYIEKPTTLTERAPSLWSSMFDVLCFLSKTGPTTQLPFCRRCVLASDLHETRRYVD